MLKSKREQELEEENRRLKKEIETLKKTLKLQSKQIKIKNEILEDLLKENKTIYYKNKYEIEKEENEKLKAQLKEKDDYIAKIRGQLEKDCTNSSKPSSTDGFKKKIHSFREKTSRKQGVQEGHVYHAPKLVEKANKKVVLEKKEICKCGGTIKYDEKIMKWKKTLYKKVKPICEDIKEELLKAQLIHNDETPYRENGKQQYAIGSFTEKLSLIECNGGRGKDAFDTMNIYPRYGGTIMGDHYALNESFNGQTAYCNIHTIRTAKGVLDIRKEYRAKEYIEFMYKIKNEVDKSTENKLSKERYEEVRKNYIKLLEEWKKEFDKFMIGRKKEYANGYSNTLSIIQTSKKQELNPCHVLREIFSGKQKVFVFQNQ